MSLEEKTCLSPIIEDFAFIQSGKNLCQPRQASAFGKLPNGKTKGALLLGPPAKDLSRVIQIQHRLLAHSKVARCFISRHAPPLFGSHLLAHQQPAGSGASQLFPFPDPPYTLFKF